MTEKVLLVELSRFVQVSRYFLNDVHPLISEQAQACLQPASSKNSDHWRISEQAPIPVTRKLSPTSPLTKQYFYGNSAPTHPIRPVGDPFAQRQASPFPVIIMRYFVLLIHSGVEMTKWKTTIYTRSISINNPYGTCNPLASKDIQVAFD